MIAAAIQVVLCGLAGLALWKLWRSFDGEERLLRACVFLGFTARAVAGALLYWISWLHLPLAPSLQLDYGLWFFGLDGRRYFRAGANAAEAGLSAILFYERTGISVTQVQAMAIFAKLFGSVASIGILLNLFSYLGMCWIILRWSKWVPNGRIPALIAIGAISLSPSAMLWSLQPLKDTFFLFLVVCLAAGAAIWQRAWRGSASLWASPGAALLMIVSLFLMAGIRWYFGFVALLGILVFVMLNAATASKKWAALPAGIAVFLLASQALVLSAASYMPPYLQRALAPWRETTHPDERKLSAAALAAELEVARKGFEDVGGATAIGVGGALTKLDGGRTVVPAAAPVTDHDWARWEAEQTAATATMPATSTAPEPESPAVASVEQPPFALEQLPVERPAEPAEPVAVMASAAGTIAPNEPAPPAPLPALESIIEPPQAPPATPSPAPPAEVIAQPNSVPVATSDATIVEATPPPQTQLAATTTTAPAPPLPRKEPPSAETASPAVVAAEPSPVVVAEPSPVVESSTPVLAPVVNAPSQVATQARTEVVPQQKKSRAVSKPPRTRTVSAVAETKPVTQPVVQPVVQPAPPAPAAAPAAQDETTQNIVMPTSKWGRLLAGAIAILVPSVVARNLGWLEIGGGRGFWWFTDIDTIVFDVIVAISVFFAMRRARWSLLSNPIFWLALVIAAVTLPLIYTVTNYGTLFRLRMMTYIAFALIPLAASMSSASREIAAPESDTRTGE
ncbi:MAG TPA: hypothetical protein VNA69_05325 [Thermoanaerobaculia bacterium]|nr:hypothetical protein [Thermoanaerobaculia bacterium]